MERYTELKRRALEKFFERMNDRQREAVFQVNGPVLILAGAGSGKTTVLVNRIANMIYFGNAYADENVYAGTTAADLKFLEDYAEGRENDMNRLRDIVAVNPIKPWNVLAITFTNKAAGELKSRIASMLGDSCNITAATFHSACSRILRREIDRIGYGTNFTIYDSDDSQRVMKACISDAGISEKQFPSKAVLSLISAAKDKLIDPKGVEEQAEGDFRLITVSKLYEAYQRRLKEANALDFDDMIKLTVEIFEQFPDVLEHYQKIYKYIMVDEYQDTNMAQYRLVSLLSAKHRNLCVVGDDDQSIYKFRGATIENILSFEGQFEGCKTIRLEQNYRSVQNILSAANCIIRNNEGRKEKTLWTQKGDGEKVVIYRGGDEGSEAKFIADTVLQGVKDGRNYSDFAVLYRMNAQSNIIERAFTGSGIPYRIIGGLRFYDRKEIRDIIAYLSVINNHNDMLRLKRIINEPKRGIGETSVLIIEQISSDLGEDPITVMENAAEYAPIARKAAAMNAVAKMFRELSDAAEVMSLGELLDTIMDKSGYGDYLTAQGDEGETRRENIEELKTTMAQYEEHTEEPSLEGFLEEISLYTDVDRLAEQTDSVTLMTIHSAKGLEFKNVFVAGMEEGIFPGFRATGSPEDMEEERRLAYVAVTRAQERLYLTNAAQRMLFGSTNRNMPSRFLKEIDEDLVEQVGLKSRMSGYTPVGGNNGSSAVISRSAAEEYVPVELSVGDRVSHRVFGEGTVLSVKAVGNDAMVEIAFDKSGTKKVMAKFARITKL